MDLRASSCVPLSLGDRRGGPLAEFGLGPFEVALIGLPTELAARFGVLNVEVAEFGEREVGLGLLGPFTLL
jgi:hypothetical protein